MRANIKPLDLGRIDPVRLALISDVHSNLPALEVVLEAAEEAGAEHILHAGDVVGYNPFPNEVVRLLQSRGVQSIQGNHDRAALSGDTSGFNPYAAQAIDWTQSQLDQLSERFLAGLPIELDTNRGNTSLRLVHGSPADPDEYVFPHQADARLLKLAGTKVLVMGHTHVPFFRETQGGILLNPGSVGQPRDGDPRASWALLELPEGVVELHRTTYDVQAVCDEIQARDLPTFLADRLLVGR
ncbi:MAG: metallophosphoesterase family protein [Thermoplasmata archaeon]